MRATGKVEEILNTVVEEIHGTDGRVSHLTLQQRRDRRALRAAGRRDLPVRRLHPALRHLRPRGDRADRAGRVGSHRHRPGDGTAVPGIFAAGDVRSQFVRQITNAVGDATTAALAAHAVRRAPEARALEAARLASKSLSAQVDRVRQDPGAFAAVGVAGTPRPGRRRARRSSARACRPRIARPGRPSRRAACAPAAACARAAPTRRPPPRRPSRPAALRALGPEAEAARGGERVHRRCTRGRPAARRRRCPGPGSRSPSRGRSSQQVCAQVAERALVGHQPQRHPAPHADPDLVRVHAAERDAAPARADLGPTARGCGAADGR